MKKNILKISILPLILLIGLSFTALPPQKENNKGNNNDVKGNRNDQGQGNDEKPSRGNQDNTKKSDAVRNKEKNKHGDHGKGNPGDHDNQNGKRDNNLKGAKSDQHDKNGALKNNKEKEDKANGKSRRETISWVGDDNVKWGFDNYQNRKRPKDHKKVTICHNTGDSKYPVTISVSENAMKAHLDHGDKMGNCTVNYSDRWPNDYIKTRENVYNSYENTWETISYSDALLRYAAEKLLGVKSTFQTQRPNLSTQEIERRENLILELQNNVTSLENQLSATKQKTNGININIMP